MQPDFESVVGLDKSRQAGKLYPDLTFDSALPQPWVDEMLRVYEFDVREHFVWGYPSGSFIGGPFPVTQIGADWLEERGGRQ